MLYDAILRSNLMLRYVLASPCKFDFIYEVAGVKVVTKYEWLPRDFCRSAVYGFCEIKQCTRYLVNEA